MPPEQQIKNLINIAKKLLALCNWIEGFDFADERSWLTAEEKIKLQQKDSQFTRELKQFHQQLNELKTEYPKEFRSFCNKQEQLSKDEPSLSQGWKDVASGKKTSTSEFWILAMAK